ncbi:acyl-CoA dehydrogenase family protein [Pseudoduganella violaceinigra]|uniref:acyl-CoA dehydrogenase family protein n=1 Tax=Pseudoduganella violaceinigra TaxID=246602 RepID=UPI000407C72C|nr:acyl-CoA dehydrogenase family protein [Pseudoduganella violaceinigra]
MDNLTRELTGYNLYTTDLALREGIRRAGAHDEELETFGALLGSEAVMRMAEEANHFKPELHTFDRQGRRIDRVEFHPSWHGMMRLAREQGMITQPFSDTRPGAWSAYAAAFSMAHQIESGSQCPHSMTLACVPVLRQDPELFEALAPKLFSRTYDPRDIPLEQKDSILVGMGMTEKQGGSDLRTNTTRAEPVADGYQLTGHKWFFSAPMCDAHLVLARTDGGLSCFFVPRYRPDGSKNAVQIQRLKDKVGNRSNASSEVEFHGAWGRMVGKEGRGIPTIIEMANITRLNCVMGAASLMRQCVVQAIQHARQRHAFGRRLADQPLMQNVLADMALESEAATQLMMRMTEAFEQGHSPLERAYQRIVTPAGKLWTTKRSIELSAEAMEVFGGNGYMDEGPMGRLYRETPVLSIWEGSGNVMALDLLRAIAREPEAMAALRDDLRQGCAGDAVLAPQLAVLDALLDGAAAPQEAVARRSAQALVLLIQARLLRERSPAAVADAFIASRFDAAHGRIFGSLPAGTGLTDIIDRAWPV